MSEPLIAYMPVMAVGFNPDDPHNGRRMAEQTLLLSTVDVLFTNAAKEHFPALHAYSQLQSNNRPVFSPAYELKRDIFIKMAVLATWIKSQTPEENSPETARLQQELRTLDQAMRAIQTIIAA